jgi:NAD(P)-dependent dehydrogenase (short-subunit alcohol dehydrogenase family)
VEDLEGRTAVVTGGGSGIGRALVLALAEEGTNVVVADIEADAAAAVAGEAAELGVQALAITTDVADRDSVTALADASFDRFGGVHILCNNAGVLVMGPITDMIVEDWEWILSVNVMGVVYGIHAFLPPMLAQGEPGHILNTASVAAFGGEGIYGTSKAAVLAISQSLHSELEPAGIGVTALCPGTISSQILGAQRNRPARFGRLADEPFGRITDYGLDPIHVGRRAVAAIRANELYAFAFPEGDERRMRPRYQARFDDILAAVDRGPIAQE